ncbi:MAG TPA: hypothetical protein VJH04_00405 [archaeon]|nr:hypothetical protein [archaeon]
MAVNYNPTKTAPNKCIMCDGTLEKSNMGMICNACRDKMRK